MTNDILKEVDALCEGIPVGSWVAISEREHRVFAYGPDVVDVVRKSEKKGEAHPLIVRVPEQEMEMFF